MNSNSQITVALNQRLGAISLFVLSILLIFMPRHAAVLARNVGNNISPPFVYIGKLDGSIKPGRPFSPDGRALIVCTKEGINVIDARTLKPLAGLMSHPQVKYASFINGGKEIFTAGGKTACYWDVQTGKLQTSIEVAEEEIFNAAIREDGKRFAIEKSPDATVAWLWWRDKKKPIGRLDHTRGIESIDFVRDGKCIYTSEETMSEHDEHVHLWDADTAKELFPCTIFGPSKHMMRVWDPTDAWLDPGGTQVLVSEKGAFSIFDLQSGRRLSHGEIEPPDPSHNNTVRQLHWSPTGEKVFVVAWRVANHDDSDVEIFDAATGKLLRTVAPTTRFMTVFPDGKRIICMSSRSSSIWDVNSGQFLQTIKGQHDLRAAISPTGDSMALMRDPVYIWRASAAKDTP